MIDIMIVKLGTIGLDIAKYTFHLFAVNKMGRVIKKKQLKRKQELAYFAKLEPCLIAMEACGGANYWARELIVLGHAVKLIAPPYVKPFVKGNKNDFNDAEGITEAAQRPNMRFVPIKCIEQQDIQNFHRQRERIKKQRKALVSQIRGLLAEYGIVIDKGLKAVREALPEILEDFENNLTCLTRDLFAELLEELKVIEQRFRSCEKRIITLNKDNDTNRIKYLPTCTC